MKILLTGGAGKIGRKLSVALSESKRHDLFFLGQKKEMAGDRLGDLLDLGSLIAATDGMDAVIHLAGVTHSRDERRYWAVNCEGTKNLINACEKNGVNRFIFISSRAAVPGSGAYGESKLAAEKALEASRLDWTILRLSEVFGTSGEEAVAQLIDAVKKHRFFLLPGYGQYDLQPVHIDDAISAIIASLSDQTIRKKYLIAGPEAFSYRRFAELIAEKLGRRITFIPLPISLLSLAVFILEPLGLSPIKKDQIKRLVAKKDNDISLARKDLGFQPKKFQT